MTGMEWEELKEYSKRTYVRRPWHIILWRSSATLTVAVAFCFASAAESAAQCSGLAAGPEIVSSCIERANRVSVVVSFDPAHHYSLAELIDIAERNNPGTQIAWERAKQAAEHLGVAKSAYYPLLAGVAAGGDERFIEPFPIPLASRGYVVAELPAIAPGLKLDYLLFDFGKRSAELDAATAEKLSAAAHFVQTNQEVAFRVATAYYILLTAQEKLQATQDTLKTAQTTQDAAEEQLKNGRATLPDVLNARAETAQALFDLEAATGDEKEARVRLTETIGVEPSPEIQVDDPKTTPLPATLTESIDQLIDRALVNRPDLLAQAAEIRVAEDAIRESKSAYLPRVTLSADAAQTSYWPTADSAQLGATSIPTWSAKVGVEWRIFDGGERKSELAIAQSKRREAQDEMREKHDATVREVWTAYIAFRTALRQREAAIALLEAADTSYSASLEAYKFGVKNLIDVVTAERQLAQARLSSVAARSHLLLEAVDIEFSTGNLLRRQPALTQPRDAQGHP